MLFKTDSIFNKIPANLNQRQIFLLEGIRFCANSISLSFEKLYDEIFYISHNSLKEESSTIIFKEAWSQIDTTYRLTNLIKSFAGNSDLSKVKPGGNFEYLLKAKPFRNSFQHIDERIDEILLELNAPIWGNISWLKTENKDLVKSFVISAGHPRDDFENKIINPLELHLIDIVDFITIESVQKKFQEPILSINLSELYRRTKLVIEKISSDLESQFVSLTQMEILTQDVLICVDMEYVDNLPAE
jgi:hypothetical protein